LIVAVEYSCGCRWDCVGGCAERRIASRVMVDERLGNWLKSKQFQLSKVLLEGLRLLSLLLEVERKIEMGEWAKWVSCIINSISLKKGRSYRSVVEDCRLLGFVQS
jgi:hypothetical protein